MALEGKKTVLVSDTSPHAVSFCIMCAAQAGSQRMRKFAFLTYQFFEIQSRWLEIISLWVNESSASLRIVLLSYVANTWQCLLEGKFKKKKKKAGALVLKSMFLEPKMCCFFFFKDGHIFRRTKLKTSIRKVITIITYAITLKLENQNSIMLLTDKGGGGRQTNKPAHKTVANVCLQQECS